VSTRSGEAHLALFGIWRSMEFGAVRHSRR
jgi:hypothetical protein